MGLGTALANVGLEFQGADASQQMQERLNAERQAAQLRSQEGQLRNQHIQAGQYGLEDMTRERGKAASLRQAGTSGSFADMATAAEAAGDPELAQKYRMAHKNAEDENVKAAIHKALVNPSPGPRPDIADEFNRYGKVKIDPSTVQLDDKGNLSYVSPRTGQPTTMNVGVAAERLGLVKPWEKEIPAGSMYVRGSPTGGPNTVIRNEKPGEFKISDGIMFNDKTGAFQQVGQGDWKLGHIVQGDKEVPVSMNSKTGEVQQLGPGGVRTGLEAKIVPPTVPGGPTMIALPGGGVAEFKPATEAVPGESNFFSKDKPGRPATPAQIVPVTAPQTPPVPGAVRGTAPGYEDKWLVKDPNNPDKWLEVVPKKSGAKAATPAPAPAAAPAAAAPAAVATSAQATAENPPAETVKKPDMNARYDIELREMENGKRAKFSKEVVDWMDEQSAEKKARFKAKSEEFRQRELKRDLAKTRGYKRGGEVSRAGLGG